MLLSQNDDNTGTQIMSVNPFFGDDELHTNYIISYVGIFPFIILLVAFIVLICYRKISDYYLKLCIGLLFASMFIRIFLCLMTTVWYRHADRNNKLDGINYDLFSLKTQVFQFTIPYYFFFMVTASGFFSAFTFYKGLRNTLFPQL